MDDRQQAGRVILGTDRASLWSGTAASWVDLHPHGSLYSMVNALRDGRQVGRASTSNGVTRAAMWSGTAGSYVDLHALLPVGYSHSEATGISSDNTNIYITGYGFNTLTSRNEALLWTHSLSCIADFNCDGTVDFSIIWTLLPHLQSVRLPPTRITTM